ncbi:extracellular solute-binding protein [Pseudomonas putida]|nr:extracellular solute-binding protein [Pseudomonas putida]
MKRAHLALAFALGCAVSAAQAADAQQPTVNLYIWGEYLAPDTLSNFEKQTGIHVVADHFDSLETAETKLLTGGSGYDVVLSAGQHLSRAIASGALQPLDKSKLPHLAGIGEEFRQHMAVFDPGNRYAGTYAWGTTGVGFNLDYRIPKEGTLIWLDALVVPKDAPHPDAAWKLMDYLMRPEVIAPITGTIHYANAITAADSLVDPQIRQSPGTYPPAEVGARLYSKNDNGKQFNRELTRAFSRLKSGT